MSRAFVKEDSQAPEPERLGAFRAWREVGLDELEPEPSFSSDAFLEVIRWASNRPTGRYVIRDADGLNLAEIK
jgi:hypothetical protein